MLTASDASENADLVLGVFAAGVEISAWCTSFEFQAHPVHTVLSGLLTLSSQMPLSMSSVISVTSCPAAPDELTAYAALLHGPGRTPLVGGDPLLLRRRLLPENVSLQPRGRTFGKPVLDAIQPMPFPVMQALLGPSFPDGNQNYWKSTLQRQMTDDAITAIVEHGKPYGIAFFLPRSGILWRRRQSGAQ